MRVTSWRRGRTTSRRVKARKPGITIVIGASTGTVAVDRGWHTGCWGGGFMRAVSWCRGRTASGRDGVRTVRSVIEVLRWTRVLGIKRPLGPPGPGELRSFPALGRDGPVRCG